MRGYATRGLALRNFKLARTWAVKIDRLDHVALAVADVEGSAQWYCDVLGFERQHDDVWGGTPVFVGNANAALALFPLRQASSGQQRAARVLHFAFGTTRDGFNAAQRELKKRGIDFEFQDHEISHSIYFHDPDGHEIEITTWELAGHAPSSPR